MSKQKLREANTLTKNEADASVVLGSYFQKVKRYNYLVFSHLAFFIITNICNTQARFPFHLLYSSLLGILVGGTWELSILSQ